MTIVSNRTTDMVSAREMTGLRFITIDPIAIGSHVLLFYTIEAIERAIASGEIARSQVRVDGAAIRSGARGVWARCPVTSHSA